MNFNLNKEKAINTMLLVIDKLGTKKADKHKVFKIIYFADQKHLVRYGRPITGDTYLKMNFGAVPSFIKELADGKQNQGLIKIEGKHNLYSTYPYDMDELSETEIECITEAIEENKNIPFNQLTQKSHDKAWENASWYMDYLSIAKAVTNDENMLEYIKINLINERLNFNI